MRVLMVSPFTTLHNMGGAEVAAQRLAEALAADRSGRVTEVWRLSALPDGMAASMPVSIIGDGSYVMDGGYSDELRFASRRGPWASRMLQDWLVDLAPDVVHLHHFVGVGSDLIPLVRRALPNARIVLTAHEMLAMCANDGKMVRSTGLLCEAPSNVECSACVRSAPVDIFLRDDYFRGLLDTVDELLSPSEFVAGRLRAWLRDGSVKVIPNCPPPAAAVPPRRIEEGAGRSRIGFFGQVIPSKGLHTLLDAALEAKRMTRHPIDVLVFGTTPDETYWTGEIAPRLKALRKGRVRAAFHGEFANERAAEMMGLVDWVAVPSLWWENAPTVMFEAMSAGRPVLAGDIGGMREILEAGAAGRMVLVGSVPHWAQALADATSPDAAADWAALQSRAALPWSRAEIVARHLSAYEGAAG